MFDVEETALQGCVRILPVVREDSRGVFIKTFHVEAFRQLGLPTSFAENTSPFRGAAFCAGFTSKRRRWTMKKLSAVRRGK